MTRLGNDDRDALERPCALLCRDRVGQRRDQTLQPVCVMQANHLELVGTRSDWYTI